MPRRAFTLIEVLVVLGIVAVVAALLVPVFVSSKRQAGERVCHSNMRQIWMAAKLYQESQTEGRDAGSIEEMGLPSGLDLVRDQRLKRFRCNGYPNGVWRDLGNWPYFYVPGMPGEKNSPTWSEYVHRFGDAAVMVTDANHTNAEPMLVIDRLMLGVTYGGSAVQRRRLGMAHDKYFFH